MSDKITGNDHRSRRCPMLGHNINFSYCRAPGSDIPCRKIFDCWWETFDVETFMRENFTEQQIQKIVAPPKDKALTLIELIQNTKTKNDRNP